MTMTQLKPGAIIVAHPDLPDELFARSVIVLLVHSEQGTVGVNIAEAPLKDRIHMGGPLQAPPLCLHPVQEPAGRSRPVGDTGYAFVGVSVVDSAFKPAELVALPTAVVLIGYSGWGAGQLAMEIEMGAWTPTTLSLETLLKAPAEERWQLAWDNRATGE